MKNKITGLVMIAGVLAFSSCKRKLPTACFTADKSTIEIGETVNFTSCTKDAVRLEWDFGDGNTATGESASHKYEKAGTYIVQARAFSKKDRASDRFSATIIVNNPPPPPPPKTRYLTRIEITAFPQTKADGSNWDGFPSTGNAVNPDLAVKMELVTGGWSTQTSEFSNAVQANLPIRWDLSPANIKLTDQNWRISILDNDIGSADTLYTTVINPSSAPASGGKIMISGNNVSLDVYFEEK